MNKCDNCNKFYHLTLSRCNMVADSDEPSFCCSCINVMFTFYTMDNINFFQFRICDNDINSNPDDSICSKYIKKQIIEKS